VPTPTLGEYLTATQAITGFGSEMAEEFSLPWAEADAAVDQADLLNGHGRRIAELCRGTRLVTPPPGTAELRSQVAEAVGVRHDWVTAAAAQLLCCDDALTPELEVQERSTREALADALMAVPSLEVPGLGESRTVMAATLGIEFSIPADWVLVRSDPEVVLLAPASLQRVGQSGLGPGPRPNGSAVRMWSVSPPGTYTLAEAVREATAVLIGFADPGLGEDVVVDGAEGVFYAASEPETRWEARVGVFAKNGTGYFFEAGCPEEHAADCFSEADRILKSMRMGPE